MDYCHFRPSEPATFFCHQCECYFCDHCVRDSAGIDNAECFLCAQSLESLGAGATLQPFWRRLPEAFRYPINQDALFLIIASVVIPLMVAALPIWGLVISLFFTGAMLKYAFTCLMRTALGNFKPPHVREAYEGSFNLLFKLILIAAVLAGLVIGGYFYVGAAVGSMLGAVVLVLLPAMLIRFAQSESVLDALNPLMAIRIVTTVGLPYGLLLAFMLIMASSVGVLHSVIEYFLPKVAGIGQSLVSNYYMVVTFHLIGNMLFQFQRELGYAARTQDSDKQRSATEILLAETEVLLKAGEYERLIQVFNQAVKASPQNLRVWEEYMEFLYVCRKPELLMAVADQFVDLLIQLRKQDKLTVEFKRIKSIISDYKPSDPSARLKIAVLLKDQGDFKTPLHLLNGLHKTHPEFKQLVIAYELMASVLDEQPAYRAQAEKCRELIVQLQARAHQREQTRVADVEQIVAERDAEFSKPARSKTGSLEVKQSVTEKPNKPQPERGAIAVPSWDLVPIEKPQESTEAN